MKIINKVVLVCLTIIVSVFSTGVYALASEKRMVIYASHPTKLVDYFVNKFKEKYGSIEVDLITGGTDTHVLLVDLRKKKVTGATAETVLGEGNIVCNKNGIPFDSEKPTITSGIRLGTPAATTRGFKETQFKQVGSWILRILDNVHSERSSQVISKVKKEVIELCSEFPIY